MVTDVYAKYYDRQHIDTRKPANARFTRDSAVIPRWPLAATLDIIEPEIASFDLPTPKTLAQTQTWSGSDAPFARYSRSSKMALFDRAHMTLYSSSIVTMALVPFPTYSRILVENCYPLVFGAPVRGEAVRFTQ